MLEVISNLISSGKTLADEHGFEIYKQDGDITFRIQDPDKFKLVTDDGSFSMGKEETFSHDYLRSVNASLQKFGRAKHSFSENKAFDSLSVLLTDQQAHSLNEIQFDYHNFDSLDVSVWNLEDSVWRITFSGFLKNVSETIRFNFKGGFPKVRLTDNDFDETVDLTEMNEQTIILDTLSKQGSVKIGSSTESIHNGEYPLSSYVTGDCWSEIKQDIDEWNGKWVTVQLRPDEFAPIKKEVFVDGRGTAVSFESEEYEELASLIVSIPEWAISASPKLRYGTSETIPNKYRKAEKFGFHTYVFDYVIPSEEICLHTGGEVSQYDPSVVRTEMDAGETKEMSVPERSNRCVSVDVKSDTEQILVGIGEETTSVSGTERITVKSQESYPVWVRDADGELLFENTYTQGELAGITKITVSDEREIAIDDVEFEVPSV